jgi:hypothetical protein
LFSQFSLDEEKRCCCLPSFLQKLFHTPHSNVNTHYIPFRNFDGVIMLQRTFTKHALFSFGNLHWMKIFQFMCFVFCPGYMTFISSCINICLQVILKEALYWWLYSNFITQTQILWPHASCKYVTKYCL